jgi:predicted permease
MHALLKDLRFALRHLRKAPGFSLTAVLTLALGIGATTSIFSLVEGVLLRPLPFSEPDHLVILGDHLGDRSTNSVTAREIGTYSGTSSAFASMGGFILANYELSGDAVPEQIQTTRLTAGALPTLGVRPLMGRFFTQAEEDARQPLALISYGLWLNRYHRDPHVLASSIVLDRKTYSIIGVMPRDFEFPLQAGRLNQAQLWIPMSLTADELSDGNSGNWGYRIVARLKDGATLTQAAADAERVSRQIMRDFPPSMSALRIRGDVTLLRENAVGTVRPLLRALLFAAAIVLVIACVNVAGLLLVRALRRHGDYAVQLALGARSSVIIRESVFEGLLLSVAGGLLGLGIAAVAIRAALRLLPDSTPRIHSIAMDGTIVIFALSLSLAGGAVCSLAPAFAALRTNLAESLKEGGRSATGASSHAWLRSALVALEIAIALVLTTTAGAFLRSFQKMRAVDPGFRPDHVLVAAYRLPVNQYSADASVESFNRAVVDRLRKVPGMIAAGITSALPSSGVYPGAGYTVEGEPTAGWKLKFSNFAITYGDYFRAMSIPVLEGRVFTDEDRADTPLVVIVNESMAKHCWPGQRAIGKRIHVGNPNKGLPWAIVVGVVGDTKPGSRDEPGADQWYFPARQPAILFGPPSAGKATTPASGYFTLRSALPPGQMIQTFGAAVAEIDPLLALTQVRPMSDAISNVEAPRRFNTGLITVFALGALLLVVTGIYGVVAFSVSQRTQEIAIRMALGAQRAGIARLVLVSGGKLALVGCGLGVLGSLAVSRLIRSLLFEISATDPFIYSAGVLIMILMALLASALPAARAASADPIDALRAM